MAHRKNWRRGGRLIFGPALTAAVLLAAAGCTSASPGATSASTTGGREGTPAPAVTAAQARQVFDHYVATTASAAAPHSASSVLSLVTGVERAVLTTTLRLHSIVVNGSPSSAPAAYSSSLSLEPGDGGLYTYGSPTFYLPAATGYPRFFVASVTRTLQGTKTADGGTTWLGGAPVPVDGPTLLLFSKASADAPWLLASVSQLPSGVTLPALATDSAGYIPTMPPSDAALLAPPDDTGPLQAAVVDDGPASTATRAVADGPLTTGMYQGARNHVDGMTAPHGDVYQWDLDGSSLPEFALRTAAGGALVFYAMTLTTTVAVPDVINKDNPIHSGPPIQIPLALQTLLPQGQPAPLVQLQSQQLLSFAAIDPAQTTAKIQVIAIGGGLTSASAS